jgi:apolipoprotein D and lipocalin family protein
MYKQNKKLILGIAGIAAVAGLSFLAIRKANAQSDKNPPKTASFVDLKKYLGKWYDIAHYPFYFQRDCNASTAEYSLKGNGDIQVINTCNKGSLEGPVKKVNGKAWVVDKKTNAKLKVQFFWPFSGDYWILDVAKDYSWAIVGHPKRETLWILSRKPEKPAEINKILQVIKENGYDPGKLIWEKH